MLDGSQLRGARCAGADGVKTTKGRKVVKTVLIVEDNELNMKLFHDLLDAHGYNILQTRAWKRSTSRASIIPT